MRRRWSVVMVDEFQDTDPVQWKVIDAAFNGHSTLVLIGDPKQAIYAFRGGDIATYLAAAATAGQRRTLDTNWRSDQPLVDCLQVVLGGARLGHQDIVVHQVAAHHQGSRLAGAPSDAPFRLRVARREQFGSATRKSIAMDDAPRPHRPRPRRRHRSAARRRRDVRRSAARAGDVAVIVEAHKDARACREALAEAGIPAVYSGDLDIFSSQAAQDWLCLLEAFEQPHRSGLVRAAATTMFFGETAASLHAGGDDLTDRIGQTLRAWADHLRARGVAAVFEAAQVSGMSERVLAWRGGERDMTDLAHLAELLHETAHRERFGLPALLDWLRDGVRRQGTDDRADPAPRQRRRGRTDHDGVGQQGPAVPGRLSPVRVQSAHLRRRRTAALPRGRRPQPRHRRQERTAATTPTRSAGGPRSPVTTSGSRTSR